jgi:hypothetical protein
MLLETWHLISHGCFVDIGRVVLGRAVLQKILLTQAKASDYLIIPVGFFLSRAATHRTATMKLQTALLILFTPQIHSFQPSIPPRRNTSLSYYKPNLPLSSRLSEIKSELANIQKNGLDKFLLDEISTAQKRLTNDVGNAEKVADAIVKKGRGEEGKLIRDTLRSDDEMAAVLNGLKGVRQELDEVRGVKELGGVVEETIKNDLLLESGELLSVQVLVHWIVSRAKRFS